MLYRCYFTEEKIALYFIKHGVYFVITAVIGAATFFIVSLIGIGGIPGLIVKAIMSTVIPAALYVAVYIRTKDMKQAEPLIRKVFKKKEESS